MQIGHYITQQVYFTDAIVRTSWSGQIELLQTRFYMQPWWEFWRIQTISIENAPCWGCRIKIGHSNLVSCFGPRMGALAKVFYRGESRGKIPCQRPNPRAKTWHKIWMTGLNHNYDTTPSHSLKNSHNKCQKSSFTYDHRRHFILPLPPVHALPTVTARTWW